MFLEKRINILVQSLKKLMPEFTGRLKASDISATVVLGQMVEIYSLVS